MISEIHGKRIGIMGGTFDPIHFGHLVLAEQIRTSFHLDQVLFIPVGKAPHKSTTESADKFQRLEMTLLATKSNPYFFVSDLEINKEGLTYTIDTVRAIKETLNADDQLYFITGADALLLLETWKDYVELIKLVKFIGATRPGIDTKALYEKIESMKNRYDVQIELCFIPALAISSTDIRQRVDQEKSIKYLLPETVEAYIRQNFLYKEHHPRFVELLHHLKNNLSSARFNHCVDTANVARNLAVLYSADPIKAEFAGICHDLAKEYKAKKMNALIDEFQIYRDPSIDATPNLAHGEVAAGILMRDFNFEDDEILEAIRWHTYGHENMSLLSKIVYVADIIEISRSFEGVAVLRALAYRDLDETILAFNRQCENHLSEKKLAMHAYTKKMIDQISNNQLWNEGVDGSNFKDGSKHI